MIPTAEEFLKSKGLGGYQQFDGVLQDFAKMHCEAQRQAIIDNLVINDYDEHEQYSPHLDEDSVRNAYPLDNIK